MRPRAAARGSLTVRITRRADGGAVLRCERPDGTVTWQRQDGAAGRFFPLHDLTHYAVETTLGHRRGFFGLVASGWNLTDFGAPWPRGPLPSDLDPAELIVGLLDVERAGGEIWSAADFAAQMATYCAARGVAAPPELTDDQLARIRRLRAELFARWHALPPGAALELRFGDDA